MTFIATKLFHKAGEGSGGGDQHNLGWYATESALTTAHATASDGDWAIVGATDTVWVWDSDTTAWKDTGQAGIELPSQTGNSGKFLTTNGTSPSWSDKPLVNTTQQSADGLTILGTPATVGTGGINIGVGSSTANAGVVIGSSASTNGGVAIGYNTHTEGSGGAGVAIGNGATTSAQTTGYLAIGTAAKASTYGMAFGSNAKATGNSSLAIGGYVEATEAGAIAIKGSAKAQNAIQIGYGGTANSEANTLKIGLNSTNYKLLDSDGTIPSDRLVHAINKYSTMPTAASTNEGWIVQFTGTTDSTYTHGHLYECVSDGGNPATYSWTEVSMGGGSGLPTQTGNAGKFLTTDGTDASWSDKPLVNTAETPSAGLGVGDIQHAQGQRVTIIGYQASGTNSTRSTAVGSYAAVTTSNACAYGYNAQAKALYAIQIGPGTNNTTNTFCVGNQNGNYEIMSADGTIPTARLAKVNTTITLAAADWSSNTQTITVSGITSSSIVWVSPDPTDQADYTSAGIICSAQGTDSLTFTATTTPSADIDVVVVAM